VTGGSSSNNSMSILFLALAGILATTLILAPRKRRNR
jgi:LPXTG-motif cell wall-anchored protein